MNVLLDNIARVLPAAQRTALLREPRNAELTEALLRGPREVHLCRTPPSAVKKPTRTPVKENIVSARRATVIAHGGGEVVELPPLDTPEVLVYGVEDRMRAGVLDLDVLHAAWTLSGPTKKLVLRHVRVRDSLCAAHAFRLTHLVLDRCTLPENLQGVDVVEELRQLRHLEVRNTTHPGLAHLMSGGDALRTLVLLNVRFDDSGQRGLLRCAERWSRLRELTMVGALKADGYLCNNMDILFACISRHMPRLRALEFGFVEHAYGRRTLFHTETDTQPFGVVSRLHRLVLRNMEFTPPTTRMFAEAFGSAAALDTLLLEGTRFLMEPKGTPFEIHLSMMTADSEVFRISDRTIERSFRSPWRMPTNIGEIKTPLRENTVTADTVDGTDHVFECLLRSAPALRAVGPPDVVRILDGDTLKVLHIDECMLRRLKEVRCLHRLEEIVVVTKDFSVGQYGQEIVDAYNSFLGKLSVCNKLKILHVPGAVLDVETLHLLTTHSPDLQELFVLYIHWISEEDLTWVLREAPSLRHLVFNANALMAMSIKMGMFQDVVCRLPQRAIRNAPCKCDRIHRFLRQSSLSMPSMIMDFPSGRVPSNVMFMFYREDTFDLWARLARTRDLNIRVSARIPLGSFEEDGVFNEELIHHVFFGNMPYNDYKNQRFYDVQPGFGPLTLPMFELPYALYLEKMHVFPNGVVNGYGQFPPSL